LKDKPIVVDHILETIEAGPPDHYRSGSMIRDILVVGDVSIEPTIASPADHSWIRKLNDDWRGSKADKRWSSKSGHDLSHLIITTGEAQGLLRTPLVIAIWESEALRCWPTAGPECTWQQLRALASSADGWGMFGHPEWGKLKYGYGFVGRSNQPRSRMCCFARAVSE